MVHFEPTPGIEQTQKEVNGFEFVRAEVSGRKFRKAPRDQQCVRMFWRVGAHGGRSHGAGGTNSHENPNTEKNRNEPQTEPDFPNQDTSFECNPIVQDVDAFLKLSTTITDLRRIFPAPHSLIKIGSRHLWKRKS